MLDCLPIESFSLSLLDIALQRNFVDRTLLDKIS